MASEEETLQGPKFSPPVYQQRYDTVQNLIKIFGSKKVMDIGCSEGKLLSTIKIHCSNVEVIVGVDIDGDILQENRFRTKPLMTEYLNKREIPLKMALYQGSITIPDIRFSNFDLISCIEVIEHLHEENLNAFPAAVFGVYRPNVIVITTPNADFNVLFPKMIGFRHPDHKFEWTREEFKNWCTSCSEQYGYTVDISFIGFGPEGTDYLGGCTQMAVFKRATDRKFDGSSLDKVIYGTYKLVTETIFPYEAPKTMEQKIEGEVVYMVNKYAPEDDETDDDSEWPNRKIPLEYITNSPRIKRICKDSEVIREIVIKLFTLTEDKRNIILPQTMVYEADFDEDDDDFRDENEDCVDPDNQHEQTSTYFADRKLDMAGSGQGKTPQFLCIDECEELWE